MVMFYPRVRLQESGYYLFWKIEQVSVLRKVSFVAISGFDSIFVNTIYKFRFQG
jgi:hypothetical protein